MAMKNFDVEQLERKIPHKIPEGFFDEVQANVLAKTIYASAKIGEKAAPVKKFSWMYAAAASVAAMFGAGYYITNSGQNTTHVAEKQDVASISLPSENLAASTEVPAAAIPEVMPIAVVSNPSGDINLTSAKIRHPKNETAKIALEHQKIKAMAIAAKTSPAKKNVEDVLEAMPETAINEMAMNTEQDVYLDLYN